VRTKQQAPAIRKIADSLNQLPSAQNKPLIICRL
jgi:hypothetical protein